MFFLALVNARIKGFGKDTNAQESAGRWIQEGCLDDSPNLMECLRYLFKYSFQIHLDYSMQRFGYDSRYGNKSTPMEREEMREEQKKKAKGLQRNKKNIFCQ